MRVVESEGEITLTVERRRGHNGEVSVSYDTKPKEALEGVDYIGAHGVLTFAHGQQSQCGARPDRTTRRAPRRGSFHEGGGDAPRVSCPRAPR